MIASRSCRKHKEHKEYFEKRLSFRMWYQIPANWKTLILSSSSIPGSPFHLRKGTSAVTVYGRCPSAVKKVESFMTSGWWINISVSLMWCNGFYAIGLNTLVDVLRRRFDCIVRRMAICDNSAKYSFHVNLLVRSCIPGSLKFIENKESGDCQMP